MSNISKCSTSNGHAIIQAIQNAKTRYTKHSDIAPQFKNIPDIKEPWTYLIDDNKNSVHDIYRKTHRIPTECTSSFHETYEKTAQEISNIVGKLTHSDSIENYIPKVNIATHGSQITGEDNLYHINKIGNYALERLNTKGEILAKTPVSTLLENVEFYGNPMNWPSVGMNYINRYLFGILGENIYQKTEEYLLEQQDKELHKSTVEKTEQQNSYKQSIIVNRIGGRSVSRFSQKFGLPKDFVASELSKPLFICEPCKPSMTSEPSPSDSKPPQAFVTSEPSPSNIKSSQAFVTSEPSPSNIKSSQAFVTSEPSPSNIKSPQAFVTSEPSPFNIKPPQAFVTSEPSPSDIKSSQAFVTSEPSPSNIKPPQAFVTSEPSPSNIKPPQAFVTSEPSPSDSKPPQDFVDIMNSTIHTIQNGTTTILKNTRYIGQNILKEMQSINNLAIAHPLATTMIALGVGGLLYKTFKKKNEQDTKKEEK